MQGDRWNAFRGGKGHRGVKTLAGDSGLYFAVFVKS